MSEPIQSIAQNNYILATQQEVSHDNTLSGNGTVDSPLGLNETVLWSGSNFVVSGTTAYLSDNIQNYNELKVCYNPIYTNGYEINFEVTNSANSYRFIVASQDTNVYQTIVSLQINGTEFYIQRARGITFNTSNSTWSVRAVSPTGAYAEGIYKIVGVNRKQ